MCASHFMARPMSDPQKTTPLTGGQVIPHEVSRSKLSPEQKAKAEKWFKDYVIAHNSRCPMCSSQQWILLDDFVAPTTFSGGGGLIIGGNTYPHFMLACGVCGTVQFINAILTGILARDK